MLHFNDKDLLVNLVNPIHLVKSLEFETRFGRFYGTAAARKFKSGIHPHAFFQIQKQIAAGNAAGFQVEKIAPEISHEISFNHTPFALVGYQLPVKPSIWKNKVPFQPTVGQIQPLQKQVLLKEHQKAEGIAGKTNVDVTEYNVRFSIAKEVTSLTAPAVGPLLPQFIRMKIRESFKLKSPLLNVKGARGTMSQQSVFQMDFTIVQEVNVNAGETIESAFHRAGQQKPKFELEIEYIGNKLTSQVFQPKPSTLINDLEKLVQLCLLTINNATPASVESHVLDVYAEVTDQPMEIAAQSDRVPTETEKHNKLKFIGPKPVAFTAEHINTLRHNRYAVTDKADGERMFLLITDGNGYLIKTDMTVVQTGWKYPDSAEKILIDGEYIDKNRLYLAFDMAASDEKNLWFEDRLERLEKVVEKLKKESVLEKFKIRVKRYYFTNVFSGGKEIWETKRDYKIDGLIYQPLDIEYHSGVVESELRILKWKPAEETTIDFFIIKVPQKTENELWTLYVKTSKTGVAGGVFALGGFGHVRPFEPKQIAKELGTELPAAAVDDAQVKMVQINRFTRDINDEPFINQSVIECRWDAIRGQFIPIRNRWDKFTEGKAGNFESIALATWKQIFNPVTVDKIFDLSLIPPKPLIPRSFPKPGSPKSPPRSPKLKIQVKEKVPEREESALIAMRDFHNWIKRSLIMEYAKGKGRKTVLDLASGKGGDLHKFHAAGVETVVGLDIDQPSINEAKRRYVEAKLKQLKGLKAYYYHLDIATQSVFTELTRQGINTDFGLVNCQFALNFFFRSEDRLDRFFKNVAENLTLGGHFIGTALNGRKVYKLLEKLGKGEKIASDQTLSPVYKIEKKYENKGDFDKLPLTGEKIHVYLAGDTVLSRGQDEWLVNFEKLDKYVEKYGLQRILLKDFGNYLPQYSGKKMSANEHEFSQLNTAFVYVKTTPSKYQLLREPLPLSPMTPGSSEPAPKSPFKFPSPPSSPDEIENKLKDWKKLSAGWQTKLNADESSAWYKRDCGGEGDCQFLSIAYGLNYSRDKQDWTDTKLRQMVATEIKNMSDQDFDEIRPFFEPKYIDVAAPKDQIADMIKKRGEYWGDNITLQILSKRLGINFMIFDNEAKNILKVECARSDKHCKWMGLFLSKGHYVLVGRADSTGKKAQVLFSDSEISNVKHLFVKSPSPKKLPTPQKTPKKPRKSSKPKKPKKSRSKSPREKMPQELEDFKGKLLAGDQLTKAIKLLKKHKKEETKHMTKEQLLQRNEQVKASNKEYRKREKSRKQSRSPKKSKSRSKSPKERSKSKSKSPTRTKRSSSGSSKSSKSSKGSKGSKGSTKAKSGPCLDKTGKDKTLVQLREMAKRAYLSSTGTKDELCARLKANNIF